MFIYFNKIKNKRLNAVTLLELLVVLVIMSASIVLLIRSSNLTRRYADEDNFINLYLSELKYIQSVARAGSEPVASLTQSTIYLLTFPGPTATAIQGSSPAVICAANSMCYSKHLNVNGTPSGYTLASYKYMVTGSNEFNTIVPSRFTITPRNASCTQVRFYQSQYDFDFNVTKSFCCFDFHDIRIGTNASTNIFATIQFDGITKEIKRLTGSQINTTNCP